jgi:hypothetical protein
MLILPEGSVPEIEDADPILVGLVKLPLASER